MAKDKQRQALALSARHASNQAASEISLPGFPQSPVLALEAEAARIVAEDAEKRLNGKASLHLVLSEGRISGFIKDPNTTVRFAGGASAVTMHD